ncbi:MAG: MATE family efflux transporter [Peptostreptococcus sp.]|uniref:MATE family efflux transporter n=1 Tax=Peptostreptococcus sp. TaxID=1262 RepID=UPI002FCC9446
MKYDLTEGSITKKLLRFTLPLMVGNMLQQFYNIADTLIVGKFLGKNSLAAVGSSYTLMVFLTSIILGLCMGSSAFFSIQYGQKKIDDLKNSFFMSFVMIGVVAVVINILVYVFLDEIITLLRIPPEIYDIMRSYLFYVFMGIMATFLYNFFASLLRALGNSLVPLLFLFISTILNIVLDLIFILYFKWGVNGAAIATVIAQYVSGIGIMLYYLLCFPEFRVEKKHMFWNTSTIKGIGNLSFLTCAQQSVMNLGILAVQGLVNSFGTIVIAAFAIAVKIDSLAYMPVQDFGNAFSTFVAQNYGAKKYDRISKGMKISLISVFIFCAIISSIIILFAEPLMRIFIDASQTEIIAIGAKYLRIEASFYFGIGLLFLFYGYYRAINKAAISMVLTIISLGSRVILAYTLSAIPSIGITGIWISVPIGWLLADAIGIFYYFYYKKTYIKARNI